MTPPEGPSPALGPGSVEQAFGTPRQAARAALVVLVTAAIWGGLTSPAQQFLPDELRSLANGAGPWFAVVTASLYVARPRVVLAIALGILGFVVMNQAYGSVSTLRDYPYDGAMWNRIALVAGPVAGIVATWLRSSRPMLVALGAAACPGVFIGEALYGLTIVADSTSPVFWSIELVAGLALIVVTAGLRLRRVGPIAVLVAASALGAALFYLAYSRL